MNERAAFEREIATLLDRTPAVAPDRERETGAGACRKRWEAFVARLPATTREALANLDFGLAVASAIHEGVRSLNDLTSMLFYTKYGQVHGYCPIKAGTRLPGGGQPYGKLYLELRTQWVVPALARPSPKLAQRGPIPCTKRENRLADAQPDKPKLDFTGQYERVVASGAGTAAPDFVFRVNQAGEHLECLVREIAVPGGSKNHRAFRLHGDMEADGSVNLFRRNDPSFLARLIPGRTPTTPVLQFGGSKHPLVRVAPAATMLNVPDHVDALVKLHQLFPLSTAQIAHIQRSLGQKVVDGYLKRYYDQDGGSNYSERADRRKAADVFDSYIRDVFANKKLGISEHAPSDVQLAKLYARTILTQQKWKKTYTRSQLDWIQLMYARVVKEGGSLPYLASWLGVTDRGGDIDGAHTYKITLSLTGGGFWVHGYRGTVTVEKTSDGGRWKKGHKETYRAWFLGLEAGVNVKLSDDVEGVATSSFEWQPPDFPGSAAMATGEIGLAAGPLGVSAGAGFVHLYGAGYLPPLQVTFTDVGPGLEPDNEKLGASIGPGAVWGKLQSKSFPNIDYSTASVKTDYAVAYELKDDVHFCLDSALLTEDARQAVRIMCAGELPAFSSPTSRLTIVGHTDRTQTDDYNLKLSARRAQNTLQAIKDVLGARFRLPASQVAVSSKGEAEAKAAGSPDEKVDPRHRRVDVILNARLVLSLRA